MTEVPLFEGFEPEPQPHKDPDLSADRRLTLRQQVDIRKGTHPLTHGPFLKHSTATDVRGWWPACPSYLPAGSWST